MLYGKRKTVPMDTTGELKFLGLKFDKYLTFNKQIEEIKAAEAILNRVKTLEETIYDS